MKRVMMKSMTMMSTDANTTACVVERPTPCVPPRVGQAEVAADRGDDEAEEDRLDETLEHIGVLQSLVRGMEVLRAALTEQEDRTPGAAQYANCVRDDG